MHEGHQSIMRHSDFAELAAFAAIVEEGSFRGAAARLGLCPSTVSHSLRALEEKLGVQLLHRTTRSVAPTEAGQALFARVGPALAGMENAIEAVNAHRDLPAGRIRLSMPRCVASQVLLPRLRAFMERFPDIQLDIAADNGFVDIVRDGFDAGIRLRESIPGDMVAVPVTPDLQTMVVASPDHLALHPAPRTPHELHHHRCIGFRQIGSGNVYRWEFMRAALPTREAGDTSPGSSAVQVPGLMELNLDCALVLDDPELMLDAAARGLGLAYAMDAICRPWLEDGRLMRVLADWSPRYPGFCLYYPNRRITAPLRALVETLKVS